MIAASPAEAHFEVLGHRFSVVSPCGVEAAAVARLFGGFRCSSNGGPRYEVARLPADGLRTLRVDGTLLRTSARLTEVVEDLSWHVFHDAVGRCERYLLVHAGVVAIGEHLVVLPGRSGSGKTTLVAGLVAAGCSYASDEIAPVDPATGRILPFPVPLSVKTGSLDVLADLVAGAPVPDVPDAPRRVLPDEVGRVLPPVPRPVSFVVAPRYVAGAATRLERVTRAAGVRDLVGNAFNLQVFGGREGFRLLAEVAGSAGCYRLTYGDLDRAVATLQRLVAGGGRPAASRRNPTPALEHLPQTAYVPSAQRP